MRRTGPLKLRARDLADMTVMAAMLQDAVARPAEMTYLARERRFVMVLSRFRWEHPELDEPVADGSVSHEPGAAQVEDARFEDAGPRRLYERVNAGVCFEHVRSVRTQKLDLKDKDQVLSLLTVEARPEGFTLVFSGGALVRLEVDAIACFLEDLGEPWPTPWQPLHDAGGADEGRAAAAGQTTGQTHEEATGRTGERAGAQDGE